MVADGLGLIRIICLGLVQDPGSSRIQMPSAALHFAYLLHSCTKRTYYDARQNIQFSNNWSNLL
jgi:hypothetical protein